MHFHATQKCDSQTIHMHEHACVCDCVCECVCVCVAAVDALWQCGHGYVCRTRTVRMAHTRLAHAFLLCASLICPSAPPAATFACKFDAKICEIFDFKRRRCRSCCRVLLLLLQLRFSAQLMPPLPRLLQLQLVWLAEIYGVCMSEFICLFHMQMQPSSNS